MKSFLRMCTSKNNLLVILSLLLDFFTFPSNPFLLLSFSCTHVRIEFQLNSRRFSKTYKSLHNRDAMTHRDSCLSVRCVRAIFSRKMEITNFLSFNYIVYIIITSMVSLFYCPPSLFCRHEERKKLFLRLLLLLSSKYKSRSLS